MYITQASAHCKLLIVHKIREAGFQESILLGPGSDENTSYYK